MKYGFFEKSELKEVSKINILTSPGKGTESVGPTNPLKGRERKEMSVGKKKEKERKTHSFSGCSFLCEVGSQIQFSLQQASGLSAK